MTYLKHWPSGLLGALLLGAGLLFTSSPGYATTPPELAPPSLIQHLRTQLKSKDTMTRQHTLIDIITLANCTGTCTISLHSVEGKKIRIENETGIGSLLDMRSLVPDLMETYRKDPEEGHRILAVSGLVNIGDEKILDTLIEESELQSENVNRQTKSRLVSFYLDRYPELTEKTMKTKFLYLADIERARQKQAKAAKTSSKN